MYMPAVPQDGRAPAPRSKTHTKSQMLLVERLFFLFICRYVGMYGYIYVYAYVYVYICMYVCRIIVDLN